MKRLAILLLIPLGAARPQDSTAKPAGYKLEEHLPADFNLFVTFDSGQKFFEGYDGSLMAKFVKSARREVFKFLHDHDVPMVAEIGVIAFISTITKHLEKCRGQVALGLRLQP